MMTVGAGLIRQKKTIQKFRNAAFFLTGVNKFSPARLPAVSRFDNSC